ncbi:hypothetical protein DPMN_036334 [Dreissena polymorpha]|uniref:Uncharacterized protein n=1 Tax=Dreissena polymorpha TaxID=45954 RepID=A0A9D4MAR2_DREPO|nr:hypothetical protein DPMN_036334 [Dreissena polymorpha]
MTPLKSPLLYKDKRALYKCPRPTTLECERSCRMPGVTRAQKSITEEVPAWYCSELLLYIAAMLSQYIVHS